MGEVRGGGGGLLLTYTLYDPIHIQSDHFPHAFIRTPSANYTTSSMPLLVLTLYVYGRVNSPPHQYLNNYNLFPYILYISLFSSLFLFKFFHHLTVTFQPFLSI